jgi:daunorubicin resistance ABC transporter ATP-binding subunit
VTDLAITAEALVKRYGSVVALDGVDLAVPTGTVLGLLGPNGAGKTTAVRILATLVRPDSGRATVLGTDVGRDPQRVRRSIGLAGQSATVDEELTGWENLLLVGALRDLPRPQRRRGAADLLRRFRLVEAGGRPARTYSGGMRRRLDLAAALVGGPPVVFLDEPTTGLDPRSRTELWAVIRELTRDGTTILLTTQYLEEADRLADRVAVVDAGRVVAEGSPAELKARFGGTVVELRLPDPDSRRRAAEVLRPYGTVTLPAADLLDLAVADGGRALFPVTRALDLAGIVPDSLAVREPSLDDAFLALTGRTPATA